jgi:hypothetical protein
VALKGVHGTRTEGMRDDLSLAAVLLAVAYVEDTWDAGDEGLVVDAGCWLERSCGDPCCQCHSLFQETISVSINSVQAFRLCDGDVIITNADNRAILLVCPVNPGELLTAPRTECKPGVAEFCQPWSWNAS